MGTTLSPIGFWSYARQDDERQLNRLRLQLSFQVQQRFGREPVKIFQDVSAIPPGADWEAKIRSALRDSAFFIPIITPNFLESKWCDEEFFIFLEKERELANEFPALAGQKRFFPIHYVDVDGVDGYSPALVPELRKAQWLDFRDLIYKDPEDEEVRERLGELAKSICQLLRSDRKLEADREAGIGMAPAVPSVDDGSAGRARSAPTPAVPAPGPDAALSPQAEVVTGDAAARMPLIVGSAVALVVAAVVAAVMLHAKPGVSDTASPPATSEAAPAQDANRVQTAQLAPCVQAVVDKARLIEQGAKATMAQATSAAQSAQDRANAEKAAHKDTPSWKADVRTYWGDTDAGRPFGLGVMDYADGGSEAGQFDGTLDGYGVLMWPKKPDAAGATRIFSKVKNQAYAGLVAKVDPDGTTTFEDFESGQWGGYGAVLFPDGSEFVGQLPADGAKAIGAVYAKSGDLTNVGYFKDYAYLGSFDGASCPV